MCATAPRISRPGSRKPSGEEYSPQRTAPLSLRTPSTDTLNRPADCAPAAVAAPTASTRAKGHSKAWDRIHILPRVVRSGHLARCHLALSKARAKPSSGRLISTGFLLASCTVIFKSVPVRMAATSWSESVMATKHPTFVQVWIACFSDAPLSTLTCTGSLTLRPRGSVTSIAPLLPSAPGRTATDSSNCRVSRWKTCCTARHSKTLPSPEHSTRHAAGGGASGACAGADCEAAAIITVEATATAGRTRRRTGYRLTIMARSSSIVAARQQTRAVDHPAY